MCATMLLSFEKLIFSILINYNVLFFSTKDYILVLFQMFSKSKYICSFLWCLLGCLLFQVSVGVYGPFKVNFVKEFFVFLIFLFIRLFSCSA